MTANIQGQIDAAVLSVLEAIAAGGCLFCEKEEKYGTLRLGDSGYVHGAPAPNIWHCYNSKPVCRELLSLRSKQALQSFHESEAKQ